MIQKILKIQVLALFTLTLVNLVYFYLFESLPDNMYSISSHNSSLNFFSYALSSLLALVGQFTGPWVLIAFILHTVLYVSLYSKRISLWDVVNFPSLLLVTAIVTYGLQDLLLGPSLKYLIHVGLGSTGFILLLTVSLSMLLMGTYQKFPKMLWEIIHAKTIAPMKEYFYSKTKNLFSFKLPKFPWPKKNLAKKNAANKKILALTHVAEEEIEDIPEVALQSGPLPEAPKAKPMIQQDLPLFPLNIFKRWPTLFNLGNKKEAVEELAEEVVIEELPTEENFPVAVLPAPLVPQEVVAIDDDVMPVALVEKPKKKDIPVRKIVRKKYNPKELISCLMQGNKKSDFPPPAKEYFDEIIQSIEDKLREFKINGQIVNVMKGPVVDTFELELGPGVKVSKVASITEDLGLALCGVPIRMNYPMKGKTTIGIEVPRSPREIIFLDSILESKSFLTNVYDLPIVMGKDAFGEASVVDLASMPHMLVAGSTGAGKSVFINTLLVSLLVKCSPDHLKLILIDPKQLELALYAELPHLLLPVVTEAKKASYALLWACQEMEKRYTILKEMQVRNITGFNKKVQEASPEVLDKIRKYFTNGDNNFQLPFIVIIIDEFADLILTKAGRDIETNVCRLAAKARAAGIHLVVATQRPSVDVITGLIKSNFPTRVSFRVTGHVDSRTILNSNGAEMLLGKGDMLYKQGIEMIRLHSAFVTEEEIEVLMEKLSHIPSQHSEEALDFIEKADEEESGSNGEGLIEWDGEGADQYFDDAVRFVIEHKTASASLLQRRLKIGYNRAANLVELMEMKGIVGPQQGSRPREVLVGSDYSQE